MLYDSERKATQRKPPTETVELAYSTQVGPLGKKMGKAFCIKVETKGVNQAFWAKNVEDQNAWIAALQEACKAPPQPKPIVVPGGAASSEHNQDIKINIANPAGPQGMMMAPGGMDPMLAYQQQQMMHMQYQQQLAQQQAMLQQQYQQQLAAQNAAYQQQLAALSAAPVMVPVGGPVTTTVTSTKQLVDHSSFNGQQQQSAGMPLDMHMANMSLGASGHASNPLLGAPAMYPGGNGGYGSSPAFNYALPASPAVNRASGAPASPSFSSGYPAAAAPAATPTPFSAMPVYPGSSGVAQYGGSSGSLPAVAAPPSDDLSKVPYAGQYGHI